MSINVSTCRECVCLMLNPSKDDSILSLNCLNNSPDGVTCQLFTNSTYENYLFYQVKSNPNVTFFFLQLPPMTKSATIAMTTAGIVPALSLSAQVTASNFTPTVGSPTAQSDSLVDRSQSTYFNSGGFPPQYVQLQLAGTYNITNVCLQVAQSPTGFTQHQILVGASVTSLYLVSYMNGTTFDHQWLNITYDPVLTNVQFVRVNTVTSPSWVAWNKFLVYGY